MKAGRPSIGFPSPATKTWPGYPAARSVKLVPSVETSTTPPSTPTTVPSWSTPSKNWKRWRKVTAKLPLAATWRGGERRMRDPLKPGSGLDQKWEKGASWTMRNPSGTPSAVQSVAGPSTSSVADWFAASWKFTSTPKAPVTGAVIATSVTVTPMLTWRSPALPAASVTGMSAVAVASGATAARVTLLLWGKVSAGSEEVTVTVGPASAEAPTLFSATWSLPDSPVPSAPSAAPHRAVVESSTVTETTCAPASPFAPAVLSTTPTLLEENRSGPVASAPAPRFAKALTKRS